MNIKPFGEIEQSEINLIERKIGFGLPNDYSLFIEKNNGGIVQSSTFYVNELSQEILIDVLFGINLSRGIDLNFWFDEFRDDIPEHSLLIGKDPGGNFILLIASTENSGIYYWDHNLFFDTSSEDKNTYLIANTFTEFINNLVATHK